MAEDPAPPPAPASTPRRPPPVLAAWVAGSLLLTLLLLVGPALWAARRSFEDALIREQLQVLQKVHEDWTARLDDRLRDTEASITRFAHLLTAELAARHAEPATWDEVVALDPDGCHRSRADRYDARRHAGIYVPRGYPLDDAERAFFLDTKRLIELYQTRTAADFANTWALPRRGGEIIYWPDLPGFIRDLNVSVDYTTTDWVTLATPEQNPGGEPRWTPTSYDPAARLWMVSVVAPFQRGGAFAGSVGHDVTIDALVARSADLELFQGSEYHVVRADGTLLVSSRLQRRIEESKGTARVDAAEERELARALDAARAGKGQRTHVIGGPNEPTAFITAHLAGPDWYLISSVPRASMLASIRGQYRGIFWAVIASVAAMVLLPTLAMARVLLPAVRRLVEGADRIRGGDLAHRFEAGGSRELVRIGEALNAMVARLHATVEEREAARAALEEKEALARGMLAERERDEQELRRRLELIEQQQQAIRAMSTPIIQVWDQVLVLPVVGVLDGARAAAILEDLLDAITAQQARFAILDLTGVDTVDDTTADHVLKVLRAVNMLGAQGVVTGLQSDVARRMVSIGADMTGITTLATLREALRWCMRAGASPRRR